MLEYTSHENVTILCDLNLAIGLILILPRRKQSPMSPKNRTILARGKRVQDNQWKLGRSSMELKHLMEWSTKKITKEAKLITP
jgi:hypothetical protein